MIVFEGDESSRPFPVWARGGQAPLRAQTSVSTGMFGWSLGDPSRRLTRVGRRSLTIWPDRFHTLTFRCPSRSAVVGRQARCAVIAWAARGRHRCWRGADLEACPGTPWNLGSMPLERAPGGVSPRRPPARTCRPPAPAAGSSACCHATASAHLRWPYSRKVQDSHQECSSGLITCVVIIRRPYAAHKYLEFTHPWDTTCSLRAGMNGK
jgi:hypothetical protein